MNGRVYVRFGKDYNNYSIFNNFNSLLEAVAFSVKYGNGMPLVKTDSGKTVACLSHTKKYIAAEATRLINQISRVYVGDHMALHTSKRQINRLIRVCEHRGNNLSCYSLIVLHIIYINIIQTERNSLRADIKGLENLIFNLANEFIRHNGHDDLARYIVDCYLPIDKEIDGKGPCCLGDFPDIHRWF